MISPVLLVEKDHSRLALAKHVRNTAVSALCWLEFVSTNDPSLCEKRYKALAFYCICRGPLVARSAVRDGPVTVTHASLVTVLDVGEWNGESDSCAPSYTPPSFFLPSFMIIP